MSSNSEKHDQDHLEAASLYALQALSETEAAVFEDHLSKCLECQKELETLRTTIESFVSWPTDVLRPSVSLWDRLSRRISGESGGEPLPAQRPSARPEWEQAAEGLSYKLLSIDSKRSRVTMLVRFAPGTGYPAHRHGDLEECHILHGELCVDDKKFHSGDFIRAEAGSVDLRVWTETGCTCVVMTSLKDTIL